MIVVTFRSYGMPHQVHKEGKPFCISRAKRYLLQSKRGYTIHLYKCYIKLLFIVFCNLKVIHGPNQLLQCSDFRAFISGALFVGFKQVTSLCSTALFSIPTTLQSFE